MKQNRCRIREKIIGQNVVPTTVVVRLIKEGFAESATFSISGGERIRAPAGDVITIFGPENTNPDEVQEQITLRVGSNLKVGTDIIDVEGQEYVGKLNGGPEVTFQNGAQDVVFMRSAILEAGVRGVKTPWHVRP